MRGGHNVKPTKEHKADGTFQPVRHAHRLEAQVKTLTEVPKPPSHFDARRQKKWKEVCDRLIAFEILTENDLDAVQVYVENWVISQDAFADIEANGMTLWAETAQGKKPFMNPSIRVLKECEKILKPLFEQFGFTPRARMGMKVQPQEKKPEDPAAKFN